VLQVFSELWMENSVALFLPWAAVLFFFVKANLAAQFLSGLRLEFFSLGTV
jgi:hypothetical protein